MSRIGGLGSKKLNVRISAITRNQVDGSAADKMWTSLREALDQIFVHNSSTLSFEELYGYGYKLCIHKHGEKLYTGVSDTLTEHLTRKSKIVSIQSGDTLLEELRRVWEDFKLVLSNIKDVLMYMDKTFVMSHNKLTVYDLGLHLFLHTIVYNENVCDRLKAILLKNVSLERSGQMIDRDLMRAITHMLHELGKNHHSGSTTGSTAALLKQPSWASKPSSSSQSTNGPSNASSKGDQTKIDSESPYEAMFELDFLNESREFYSSESTYFLQNATVPDYLQKIEKRLEEEQARCDAYLVVNTHPKVIGIAEHELITNHASTLVSNETSGCRSMFNLESISDLKRMYALFSRVDSTLPLLRDAMGATIKAIGDTILQDREVMKAPISFVDAVMKVRAKFTHTIEMAFENDKRSQKKMKEAFEDFMNIDGTSARSLADYSDDMLKNSLRGVNEQEADSRMDKFVDLFRYLTDKDVFECYYKNLFAKRLLSGRSVSDELEKSMIGKLKAECGYIYVAKLESMYTDKHLSKDILANFRSSEHYKALGKIELDVMTLTSSNWPIVSKTSCTIPCRAIEECQSLFTMFYNAKYEGRKLIWATQYGTADIKANYASGKRDLNVSTYQMAMLSLFNDKETYTLQEITTAVDIEDEMELKRHLLSLCTSKHRILIKSSKAKGIHQDDTFTYNEAFTSRLKRIKVSLVSMKEVSSNPTDYADTPMKGLEAVPSRSTIPAAVEEDRRHLVESSIVRIMKSRKSLLHHDLIAEVTRQLSNRFNPTPGAIKKRVESLIERDYLARDANDTKLYNYLA